MPTDPLPKPIKDFSWMLEAACRGYYDPSIFLYPEPGSGINAQKREEAKAVCATCPVREPCERAGAESPGIWGGLSEAERDQARKDRYNEYRRGQRARAAAEGR